MEVYLQLEVFQKLKKYLDGFIFYRIEDKVVLVRQVSPCKEITKLLKTNAYVIDRTHEDSN